MPMTLYDAVIPGFRQTLGAVTALVDKAEAFCTDRGIAPAELLGRRIAPDMLPLAWQVKWVASHSGGAIVNVREGRAEPAITPPPQDFAGLRAKLTDAAAVLAAVEPAELEDLRGNDLLFSVPGKFQLPFTAEGYLLSFAMPNLHFHASMTYAILRAAGLAIGKADYLGQMQLKA